MIDVPDRDNLLFSRMRTPSQRLFWDMAACAAHVEQAGWGNGFTCCHCATSGTPYRYSTRLGVVKLAGAFACDNWISAERGSKLAISAAGQSWQ